MAARSKWRLSGDYFENCNCDVVCPCLVSTAPPLTARPTQGECNVPLVFHIDKGDYDGLTLDGLNVAVVAHTPGPMASGNWTLAAYVDERADEKQAAALARAIFGGGEGGPMAAFAPMVGTHISARRRSRSNTASTARPDRSKSPTLCIWRSSLSLVRTRVGRLGLRLIRLRPTSSHSAWAARAIGLPITACAGTIQARTATTRRSTGRTNRHSSLGRLHAGRGTCPTGRLTACCCATVGLSAAALQ